MGTKEFHQKLSDALFAAANAAAQAASASYGASARFSSDEEAQAWLDKEMETVTTTVAWVVGQLGLPILTLPFEPKLGDEYGPLLAPVVELYASTAADDSEMAVAAHAAAAERLMEPRSWLNSDVGRSLDELEGAWRRIATHAAEQLAQLHQGVVDERRTGFSQFDQALIKIRTAPVAIHSLIDGAVNAAYCQEDQA